MNERHQPPFSAGAGFVVYELNSRGAAVRQCNADIRHGKRDVVQPLAAPGDEASDRRVFAQRLQQFQPRPGERQHDDLHSLVGDDFAGGWFKPQSAVVFQRRI